MKVLAVEVPAPCALDCAFCRTPEHDVGDPKAVLEAVKSNLDGCDELYVTSNGETGRSSIFGDLLQIAKEKNIRVSVLCATAESVVPGLARVEVSMNKYTAPLAELAIARAREVGVPVVISMVDTGQPVDAVEIAEKYRVDGVLIRALQAEGRSKKVRGDIVCNELARLKKRSYAIMFGGRETSSDAGFAAFTVGNGALWSLVRFLNAHTNINSYFVDLPFVEGSAMQKAFLKSANKRARHEAVGGMEPVKIARVITRILSRKEKRRRIVLGKGST